MTDLQYADICSKPQVTEEAMKGEENKRYEKEQKQISFHI
jgi:hypothetical protein